MITRKEKWPVQMYWPNVDYLVSVLFRLRGQP